MIRSSFTLLVLMTSLAAFAKEGDGGSNNGGSDRSLDWTQGWSRGRLGLLESAEMYAKKNKEKGQFEAADKDLANGIELALGDGSTYLPQSLMYLALTRGKEIADALLILIYSEAGVEERKSLATTVYDTLTFYYKFIRSVATNLDVPHHLPYQYRCGSLPASDPCGSSIQNFNAQAYEERFVAYALDQIEKYLNEFTLVSRLGPVTGDYNEIHGKGSPKVLFTVLEHVIKNVKEDLQTSIWPERFSCAVMRLEEEYNKVLNYNLGNTEMLGFTDPEAINTEVPELRRIIQKIQQSDSCADL